ncbi:MAG: alpha/beta fold hydrolase [Candidatus Omnitrophica bacterium]|nr:alpha/beta fold hydrolase [Candidatus Omnitrophota bacterium]
MKKIYIAVLIFLSLGLLLFIASFFYLDKVNHKTFYYLIKTSGRDSGTIKVERFVTEDKIIYKSVTSLPFEPVYTEYRSRMVLDKNYNFESYTKERVSGRVTDTLYLENFKNLISFVSRYESRFACAENIPIRKETFVFEEDSPVTYLPIIENYNFSKGRSQGFNAISCFNTWSLPPMKRFITLTSINDEYLKIDSRRIKTENLLLKIRDYPQGALWVGKSDRAIMKIEVPAKNMTITRTFGPKIIKAAIRTIKPDGYISKDVFFKSKGAELSGTLTFPSKEGKYPVILFAPSAGPQDRDYQGLFASLADHLSRNGFVCLRFDKRGVGSSGGELSSSTGSDEIEDIEAALQCLKGQNMVDPNDVMLIGHASGSVHALKIAVKDNNIKGLIMMAPSIYTNLDERSKREELQRMSQKTKWTDDYLNLVIRTVQETQNKVAGSNGDWIYILGKKCFLGNIKDELTGKPPDITGNPDLAVLILQGKDTDELSADAGPALDKIIADAGHSRHTLKYYAYLGQFFGQKVNDGAHRYYYDIDKEVLENIRNWLNGIL